MSEVIRLLAFTKVPKVERVKKNEKKDPIEKKERTISKLLNDILEKRTLLSIVPTYTAEGVTMNKAPCKKWIYKESTRSANPTGIRLRSWEREDFVAQHQKSLPPICIVNYTEEEYVAAKCKSDQWDKKNTDYLFSLCRLYNLRWPVIVDTMASHTNCSFEACQLRYYTVSKLILSLRQSQGKQLSPEEECLYSYTFDNSLCKNRRQTLERSFSISCINYSFEKLLYEQILEIDQQLNRLSNTEVEGYGPYDDLDCIPTVMKEDPVYLKPTPGVSLRSARFDNNTASSFFADNTQKRLIQVLSEMKVLVPRMATKRICDTLDYLKQDIVKLIMLRKYIAQNNFKAPNPVMNPTNDTKVRFNMSFYCRRGENLECQAMAPFLEGIMGDECRISLYFLCYMHQNMEKVEKNTEKPSKRQSMCVILLRSLGYLLMIASVGILLMQEIPFGLKTYQTMRYINQAYVLQDDVHIRNIYDHDIVLLKSLRVKPHPQHIVREPEFDLSFGNQLKVHRISQYCQWKEIKETIMVNGEETSRTRYVKDWFDHLVSSDDFEDEKNHQNVDRDPFPSRTNVPRRVLVGNYVVDSPYFDNMTISRHRYSPSTYATDLVPTDTKRQGFLYVSKSWYYSKYTMIDVREKLGTVNMTVLTEEEEEIFESECEVGDIRIGFDTERAPIEVTVVGIQNDYRIMPIRQHGEAHYIIFDRQYDAKDILPFYETKYAPLLNYYRVLCGIWIGIGALLTKQRIFFKYMPNWMRGIACGCIAPLFIALTCRIAFYGLHDSSVYYMLFFFALPFLLFVSLNVLYRLIQMYRYGLRLIEKQRKEKKE